MPFDGVTWSETRPDNTDLASEVDDYIIDLKKGVRARLAKEHLWPTAQTGTGEGGQHNYITFQPQAAAPTLAGTTAGSLYFTTDKHAYVQDSAGTSYIIVKSGVGAFGNLVAKAWVCMNGAATAAILGAAGVASVARTTAGSYSVTFSNTNNDTNYCVLGSIQSGVNARFFGISSKTTAGFSFVTLDGNGTQADVAQVHVVIYATGT